MPLTKEMFEPHVEVVCELTKFFFKGKPSDLELYRMNQKLKSMRPEADGLDMLKDMVRLWRELGVAEDVGKTKFWKTRLLAPPEEHMAIAADEIGEMFGFTADDKNALLAKWRQGDVAVDFDIGMVRGAQKSTGQSGWV